jgi:uncharacterized OB-fold protein
MTAPQLQLSALSSEERGILEELVVLGDVRHEPEIGPRGVTYSTLGELGEKHGWVKLVETMERLADGGYLKGEDVEHGVFCPSCGSPHVYSRYMCPKCQSSHIERITLMQHMFCGYQGERRTYLKGGRLVCPKCGTDLGSADAKPKGDGSREDYKIIGSTFQCEKCEAKFDKPNITHFCPQCGAHFDYRTAIIRKLYAFKLSPETIQLLQQEPNVEKAVDTVEETLEANGFKVTRDVQLLGQSGSPHTFTLVGERNGSKLLFDVATLGNQNELIALLGKKMDIGSPAYMIDVHGVDELVNLGKVYGIPVLNAKRGLAEELGRQLAEMGATSAQRKGEKKKED